MVQLARMISDHLICVHSGEYDPEVVKRLSLVKQGLTEISNLERCTSLTDLSLANNSISLIMNLDHMESLLRLDLSFNRIEILGSGLKECVNLVSLNLKGNLIKNTRELAALAHLDKLDSLYLRDESGKNANPVCDDEQYVSYMQRTLKNLSILDGGHLVLVDCVNDMHERLAAVKPDEGAAVTPPHEPWFSSGDTDGLAEDAPPSAPGFVAVDDTARSISDMLQVEGTMMIRKAQGALSKSQKL